MRTSRYGRRISELRSSFLSCSKDTEEIIRKLFVDSKPYDEKLKRLLLINTPDCLTDTTNQAYIKKINETSIADLKDNGYLRFKPQIKLGENEEVKSYIHISFDNFTPNEGNPYFRDCIVMIDILCDIDCWDIGDYKLRPIEIAGYIDGLLNGEHLSGIGTFRFIGCNELVISDQLSGYCLMYAAVHGDDDYEQINIPDNE